MQHQGEQTGSVGHGGPDVTLLLEQLVQLVPLWTKNRIGRHDNPDSSWHTDSLTCLRVLTTRTRSKSTSALRSFSQL